MIILNSLKLTSRNPAETRKIARLLSRGLRGGDTVALRGQLGSGKTVFVKGLAAGLGLRGAQKLVTSPTFALVNLYEADWPVYHMDWYRLSRLAGDDRLMVDECLADRQAVTVIEWSERAPEALPSKRWEVCLELGGGQSLRLITLKVFGQAGALECLAESLGRFIR